MRNRGIVKKTEIVYGANLKYEITDRREVISRETDKLVIIRRYTYCAFRVRAWRIRHRKETLVPYEKKTGPKRRYKEESFGKRNKRPTEKNDWRGNIASHGQQIYARLPMRKYS